MEYNLTRKQAATILGISTRTLDRRIRKGLFTYKKKGNKVYLAEEEIKKYNNHKEVKNIVYDTTTSTFSQIEPERKLLSLNTEELISKLSKHFDQHMTNFLEILSEKDKKIEEKNKVIFALQHKVAELETKLKNTVALPLYQEEKEELILEKENLKIENKVLEDKLKKEKIRNIALIGVLVIITLIMVFVAV